MASPSYATDLNDIYTDGGTWTTLTGRTTDPDTDDYIQGSSCWSHDPFSSGIEGGVVNSSETITAGHAVFVWTKADISPALATHAAGGVQVLIGNASTALKAFYVAGSDTLVYGGWKCIPVDPTLTQSTSIGSPSSVTAYFGVRWNVPSTGPNKGYPFKIDAIRWGTKIDITAGDITTPATWSSTAVYDATTTRQWGICQPTDSGVQVQGIVNIGTGATAAYFDDSSGGTILFIDTEWTSTSFTQIVIDHASTVFNLTGASVRALGTNNPGRLVFNNASTVSALTNNVFESIGITTLRDAVVATGNTWKKCDQITQNGATITGGTITESTNSSALLIDTALEAADVTDVSFVDNNSAPTNAHSIELTATGSHTFTDITFSGGGGTPGSNLVAASGSTTADVYNNSGGAVTINVTGGDTPSVRNAAGSTTTVTVSVPVTVTVVDKNNDPIEGVSVGVFLSSDDTEVINTTTNASGVASGTFGGVTPANVYLRARDSSTGSTRYISASTSGSIESGTGLSATIVMQEDSIVGS